MKTPVPGQNAGWRHDSLGKVDRNFVANTDLQGPSASSSPMTVLKLPRLQDIETTFGQYATNARYRIFQFGIDAAQTQYH